jgi:hypothetical protein
MFRAALCLCAIALTASALQAQSPCSTSPNLNVTGTWYGYASDGVTIATIASLSQSGSTWSGTYYDTPITGHPGLTGTLSDGTINGNAFNANLTITEGSLVDTGSVMLTLSADGNALSGTYSDVTNTTPPGSQNGPFGLVRVPPPVLAPSLVTLDGTPGGMAVQDATSLSLYNCGGGPIEWAASAASTPSGWLAVGPPNSGTLQGGSSIALTLTATPGNLTASGSPYIGTVTVSAQDSIDFSPTTAAVQFSLGTAQLQASPSSLSFNANQNGDVPPSKTISVVPTATAVPPYTFTLQTDGGQAGTPVPFALTTRPAAGGVAPAQIVVSVNQGTQPAGTLSGRIRIIDSYNLENDVSVSLTVNATPQQLQVTPGILHFAALEDSPASLTASLLVSNSGGNGPLAFTTSVVGGSSWITGVTPSSGQTAPNSPVLIQVSVSSSGLPVGSYHDVIAVSSSAGVVYVTVTLFVGQGGAIMAVNLTGFRLQAVQGGGYSNTQTIQILDIGDPGTTVGWSADLVTPASWLALGSSSGTATTTTPGLLTFTLSSAATQMPQGGYYALIRITDPNSLNSPQFVLVVLDLQSATSPPLPDPNPGGFFLVATAGGSATSAQVLTINTSSAMAVPFQVSASTSDGGTWLVVDPSSGTSSGATPGTVNVSANPAAQAQGVFGGSVNVSMSGVLRSVNVTEVVLPAGDTAGSHFRSRRPGGGGSRARRAR